MGVRNHARVGRRPWHPSSGHHQRSDGTRAPATPSRTLLLGLGRSRVRGHRDPSSVHALEGRPAAGDRRSRETTQHPSFPPRLPCGACSGGYPDTGDANNPGPPNLSGSQRLLQLLLLLADLLLQFLEHGAARVGGVLSVSETPSGARARASPGPAAAPSASPLHQGRRGPDLAAAAASSPGSRADRRTRPAGVGVAAAASPSSGCQRLPSAPHAAPAAATTAAGERCAQGACAVYVELGRAALRKAGEDTARVDGGTCVLGLLGARSERRTDAHLPAAWALARGRLGRGGERSQPGRPTVGGARGMCRKGRGGRAWNVQEGASGARRAVRPRSLTTPATTCGGDAVHSRWTPPGRGKYLKEARVWRLEWLGSPCLASTSPLLTVFPGFDPKCATPSPHTKCRDWGRC